MDCSSCLFFSSIIFLTTECILLVKTPFYVFDVFDFLPFVTIEVTTES